MLCHNVVICLSYVLQFIILTWLQDREWSCKAKVNDCKRVDCEKPIIVGCCPVCHGDLNSSVSVVSQPNIILLTS